MTRDELRTSVEAAQGGDRAAFERVARVFREGCIARARERLDDPDRAEDVVQEAIADAFRLIGQLREPAAFGGWLRTIVAKHCDRVNRRRRPTLEAAALLDEGGPGAEEMIVWSEQKRELWGWVEALAAEQRTVVALHYFGEVPLAQIATLLRLPLSTVKKRLHDARARLRRMAEEGGGARRAPAGPAPDVLALHRAIRDDDVRATQSLLARRPDLLEAPEDWTAEEAYDAGLPLAHARTPLIVAAARGSLSMVESLLALGARVDRACACANAESALWAAVARGARDVARALLEAGANPNAQNRAGLAPLHLAELRGDAVLCDLLRAHAADPELPALDGTTPAECGRRARLAAELRPVAAKLTLETGIKAIDLLAPLTAGALVCVHGAAETGLTVLVAELTRRLAGLGGAVIWATWDAATWPREEIEGLAAEVNEPSLEVVAGAHPLGRALARAAELREELDQASLVVFEAEGHAAELDAALAELTERTTVAFVVRPWTAVTRGELSVRRPERPYDAWIVTDPAMARRGLFPAIDARASGSAARVSPQQERLRERAVLALAEGGARADRLRAFLSQPFVVCEHQRGVPGAYVTLTDTLDGVARILDGQLDAADEAALRYLGPLPQRD